MGIALYPTFKPKVPNNFYGDEGKVLIQEIEVLAELGTKAGITPITSFGDNREIPEDFDGDPDDLDELMGPFDEWFPASDGLASVESTLAVVRSTDDVRWERYDRETVIAALELLRDWLADASKSNAHFRFEAY